MPFFVTSASDSARSRVVLGVNTDVDPGHQHPRTFGMMGVTIRSLHQQMRPHWFHQVPMIQ
jgi:hypothetical protein